MGNWSVSIVQSAWTGLALYWAITAPAVKRTTRAQTAGSRLSILAVLAAGFGLLFSPSLRLGVLGQRVLPATAMAEFVGVALTLAGVGFAVWARRQLGANWSAAVTIKREHKLVRSGPYRFVRHPIYAGAILACVGSALVVGESGALVGAGLAIVAWLLKIRVEERFLATEFGDAYVQYRYDVKSLVPFVI